MALGLFCKVEIIVFALALVVTTESLISLTDDGGYRQVLVAISDGLATTDIDALLLEFEDLFRKGSAQLHVSTRNNFYFDEVIFLLPKFAGVVSERAESTRRSYTNPNLVIVENGIFDDLPFTLQHSECGHSALRIYFPASFLATRLPERALVQQWAHFRYGVFDENGFLGDPVYPLLYRVPGDDVVLVTGCTNEAAEYTFKDNMGLECDPESLQCYPELIEFHNDSIISSLMDGNLPPKVTQFCDPDSLPHNRNAPNMQNAICREKSVWDIISTHEDFQPRENITVAPPTKFKYVLQSEPRIMLVIEATKNLALKNRIDSFRNAFTYFVAFDLPTTSKVGIINLRKIVKPTSLQKLDVSSDRLFDDFPEAYGEVDVCVRCGIDAALEVLAIDDISSDGTVLLVTSVDISQEHLEDLKRSFTEANIRLYIIFFCDVDQQPTILEQLALASGGRLFPILAESSFIQLYEIFRFIYESTTWHNRNNALIKQKVFYEDSRQGTMQFVIDEPIESFRVILTGPNFIDGPPVLKDKLLLTLDGQEYLNQQQTFIYKIRIPAYVAVLQNPPIGKWQLSFQRKEGYNKPIVAIVRGTHSNFREIVYVRSWMSSNERKKKFHPRMIYAEVTKGYLPVANAEIEVSAYNNADGNEIQWRLLDSGDGNVDIRTGDGIYSRGITQTKQPSYYTLTVTVHGINSIDNDVEPNKTKACCGSRVTNIARTGSFERTVILGTFLLNADDSEGFPPRRIVDLHVSETRTRETGVKHYVLMWTAPGDDYDHGTASEYEMKVFETRDDAFHNFEVGHVLRISEWETHGPWLKPAVAGTIQTIIIQLNNLTSGTYFLALRTTNFQGQHGDVSNIVQLFHPEPFDSTKTPYIVSTVDTTVDESTDINGMISTTPETLTETHRDRNIDITVGVTCAVLAFFFFIGACLFLCLASRKKVKKIKKVDISPPYFPRHGSQMSDTVYKYSERTIPAANPAFSSSERSVKDSGGSQETFGYYTVPSVSRTLKDGASMHSVAFSGTSYEYDHRSLPDVQKIRDSSSCDQINLPFHPHYTSSFLQLCENGTIAYRLGTDV